MKALPTVAIVGQANVGKSSLFNRLYGTQEAIVAREAGTTRDNVIRRVTLSQTTRPQDRQTTRKSRAEREASSMEREQSHQSSTIDAPSSTLRSFWLVDTAGLKKAEDDFEASIQDQIEEAADAADVIVVVVDGSRYPSDDDRTVAKKALRSKKPVILVINKTDLRGALPDDEFRCLGIPHIVRTSAEHARGLQKLTDEIVRLLPSTVYGLPSSEALRIALIGRPNVGKSHLFNRLAGKQQAVVAPIAGTTRDVNRVDLAYKGRAIELLDTAGIRRSGKQTVGIEKFSVLRTLQAIQESDICCLLMDVDEHSTQLDQKLAGMIKEAGKGLIIVISKWDKVAGDDKRADYLRSAIAATFDFVPWAPLVFTSAVTGVNVTKIFELATLIDARRHTQIKTVELNRILQQCTSKHPPAGLKNTFPKLRYIVQTDVAPPWFVIFGSNLGLLHWSYKRYLERQLREQHDFSGTPIMFSFRQDKKSDPK